MRLPPYHAPFSRVPNHCVSDPGNELPPGTDPQTPTVKGVFRLPVARVALLVIAPAPDRQERGRAFDAQTNMRRRHGQYGRRPTIRPLLEGATFAASVCFSVWVRREAQGVLVRLARTTWVLPMFPGPDPLARCEGDPAHRLTVSLL